MFVADVSNRLNSISRDVQTKLSFSTNSATERNSCNATPPQKICRWSRDRALCLYWSPTRWFRAAAVVRCRPTAAARVACVSHLCAVVWPCGFRSAIRRLLIFLRFMTDWYLFYFLMTRFTSLISRRPATFYRVMLCIARTMPSQHVRLSVRPPVCLSVWHTPVFCRNG